MHPEQEQAGDVLHPENITAHNGINNLIFKSNHPGEDFRVLDWVLTDPSHPGMDVKHNLCLASASCYASLAPKPT